jgi:acetyl-CoA decarbonylase/synthase complex subunit gamma
VEVSVAGGQFKPQLIKDGLDSQELRRLKHKKIVLPGLAARLSGETEDITGWEVKVGPVDSAQIPSWMKDNW